MKSNNFLGLTVSTLAGLLLAKTYPTGQTTSTITKNVVKFITILIPVLYFGGKL